MPGQYINSINKQSLGSQQLIHHSYKENIKITCNSLNKNIVNTKKETSLKDKSISIEMFDNYNQLYNKANNKLSNINFSTKLNNSNLQNKSNSSKTSLSIDNNLYKDHLIEKTTGSLYSSTMADKLVSSSSNKDITNKKQIMNSKTKPKTKPKSNPKPKPKTKPKPKPKSKAKIKNTLTSSVDISSQSLIKTDFNKTIKEDVKVSNKIETSMISTATTLALSGNKMVDTMPQSQNISTEFSNQNLLTKDGELKSSNNINQSNSSLLKSKSNSSSNDNNSPVNDQEEKIQKLNDTSEPEKEIKAKSIKDSHLVPDSNNFVDNLVDTSTLNILSDSLSSFETSTLANKIPTTTYNKVNDILDNENQLALSELFNSENMDGKLINPLNSYVSESNTISNTDSSTIYQSNLSCMDLSTSTNSPIVTSQVLSSSNEDIMKNLGVSTSDLIMNDAFGPTTMALNQEKTNLDSVNLLESQTLDSLKDVSNLKSNNDSSTLLLKNELNMASSIRSYQDILMNEKNDIENSQFPSTTIPLNSTTSSIYDKYIKSGNVLEVSSSAGLPSVVTKSNSPISKAEHELINYNGMIKPETLDPAMSSLPEYYQEKSILGHSSQGFLQNAKAEPGSSQSFLQNAKVELGSSQGFLQNAKVEPGSSQSFLHNVKVESGSPAISIGSLYPSPLNPEILNSPSPVSTYFSSTYDSSSLETAKNILEGTLSSTSLIKTENIVSPMIPGTESISSSLNLNSNNIGTPSLKINSDVITTANTTSQNLKGISPQTVYNKELGIQRPYTETFPKTYHSTIETRQSPLSLPTGEATGPGQILSNPFLLENNSSVDLLKKKLMLEQANKMSSSATVLPLIYQNQNINVLYVKNEDMTDVVNPSSPLDVSNSNLQTNPLLMNTNLRKNLKRRLNYFNPLMSLHQYNNLKSLNHKKLMRKQALHRHSNLLNKDLYMYSGLPSTMDSYYQNKLYVRTPSSSSPISSDGSIHHLPNVNPVNNYNYGLPLSVWNQQALDLSRQGDYKSISSNLDVASQGMNYLSPTTSTTTKLGSLYTTPNYKTTLSDIKYPTNQNMDMLLEPSSINSPMDVNYGIMDDNAFPKDMNPLMKLNSYYIPTTTTLSESNDKSNNIDGMKPHDMTVVSQNNEKPSNDENNKLEEESATLLNANSVSSNSNDISSVNNILHDKIEKSNLRKIKKTKDLIKKKSADELKKINKKKKVKGKEKGGEIKTEDNIENLRTASTESITNLSSPLASQSSVIDDSVLTAQGKNNSCLITPIHTPTLSEDTTISSENDINPALVIPKMTSISTPKRKGNFISKADNHIHTPVSPTTMNNIPYISTPPYTSNLHTSTTVSTTTATAATISKTSNTISTNTNMNKSSSKLHPHVSSAFNNKSSKASSSYKNDPNNRLGHNAYTSLMKKDIQSKTNGIPKITLVPWADQNTYVYQIELGEKIVSRRFDNQFVNGTKLLNVAGLTRGKRDAILKNEPVRNVVKNAPFHLKGVWIPIKGLEYYPINIILMIV